jgi:hypothetical protein
VNAPVLRNGCGTFLGSLLHRALDELSCLACEEARIARRAEQAERQAERNLEVLAEAVRAHDRRARRRAA